MTARLDALSTSFASVSCLVYFISRQNLSFNKNVLSVKGALQGGYPGSPVTRFVAALSLVPSY